MPPVSEKYLSTTVENDKVERGYLVKHRIPERRHWFFFRVIVPISLSLISILVDGILSGFRKGESIKAQRGWIMGWLIVGMMVAWLGGFLVSVLTKLMWEDWSEMNKGKSLLLAILDFVIRMCFVLPFVGIFFAPAIGGLVVVRQMIKQYGNCVIY